MLNSVYSQAASERHYKALVEVIANPRPSGAVVRGAIGLGKSSLVAAALAAQKVVPSVIRLFCSPVLSHIPYGVLSPYLTDSEILTDPINVLRDISRTIASKGDLKQSKIIVIEQAQFIDDESSFVLSTLMENSAAKLIVIGAHLDAEDDFLSVLEQSAIVTSIVMQPMDVFEIGALMEALLGGGISQQAAARVHQESGGNPRIAKTYIAVCLERGLLYLDQTLANTVEGQNGIWFLNGQGSVVGGELESLIEEIHRSCTPTQQQSLELLALAGAQDARLLDLAGFEFRDLIVSGQLRWATDKKRIEFSAGVHQRVLRSQIPLQRSTLLFEQWSKFLEGQQLEPAPGVLSWGAQLGNSYSAEDIRQAARHAAVGENYELAWGLALQQSNFPANGSDVLFEAEILVGADRYFAARSLLLQLVERLDEPELINEAFTQLLIVLTSIGSTPETVSLYFKKWESQINKHADPKDTEMLLKVQRLGLQLLGLWQQVNGISGQLPEHSRLEQLIAEPLLPLEAKAITTLMLCDAASVQGKYRPALDALDRCYSLIAHDPRLTSLFRTKLFFRRGWNLLHLGEQERLAELLHSYDYGGDKYYFQAQGARLLLSGTQNLVQGRTSLAIREMAEAVSELKLSDPAQLQTLAENMSSIAIKHWAGLQGRESGAESNSMASSKTDLSALLGEPASRQRILARGAAAMAGTPFEGEAVTDFPLFERLALLLSTSQLSEEALASDDTNHRLLQLCQRQDGELSVMLVKLCHERLQSGPESMEQLATEAFRHKEFLIGIEALVRAALRYTAQGQQRAGGLLLRQAAQIIEEQKITPSRFVSRALALTELTAREAEIVQLALSGKNNAQIARSLTVSQRTIEGHLYRVFTKLGISERSELHVAELDFGVSQ